MREDVEVFLSKAKKFDDAAKHFLREGIYDLAAFFEVHVLSGIYKRFIDEFIEV